MGRRAVITVDYLYTIGTTNKLTIEEPFEVNMDDGEVGFEFSELKALREMDYKIDLDVPDDYDGSDDELIAKLYRVTEQIVNTYARVVFDIDVKVYE